MDSCRRQCHMGSLRSRLLYSHDDMVELNPNNSDMEQMGVPAGAEEVEGVLIGQFKDHRNRVKHYISSRR